MATARPQCSANQESPGFSRGECQIGFHPQYQFRKEDDAPHFQNEKEATEYIAEKLAPYIKEDKNMLSWLVDYYSEPGKN